MYQHVVVDFFTGNNKKETAGLSQMGTKICTIWYFMTFFVLHEIWLCKSLLSSVGNHSCQLNVMKRNKTENITVPVHERGKHTPLFLSLPQPFRNMLRCAFRLLLQTFSQTSHQNWERIDLWCLLFSFLDISSAQILYFSCALPPRVFFTSGDFTVLFHSF